MHAIFTHQLRIRFGLQLTAEALEVLVALYTSLLCKPSGHRKVGYRTSKPDYAKSGLLFCTFSGLELGATVLLLVYTVVA
jgi:hypothetical protein